MFYVLLILLYILLAELYVYWKSQASKETSYDIIMVLGANGNMQSPVTRDRTLMAAQAKEKYPQARFLLTGNEARGEMTAYKKLLGNHGFYEFIVETESTTTWQNLKYSKELLKTLSSHDDKILIVTSQFHQKRALAMARSQDLTADVFGKDPRKYQNALLYFLKERLSIYKYFPLMLLTRIYYFSSQVTEDEKS